MWPARVRSVMVRDLTTGLPTIQRLERKTPQWKAGGFGATDRGANPACGDRSPRQETIHGYPHTENIYDDPHQESIHDQPTIP